MTGNQKVNLSDGEWRIMNQLWENPSQTITQLTKDLKADTGWGKNTVITMLNRLEAKGAVGHDEGEKAKLFYPAIDRAGAVLQETRGFLNRVYEGSLSLMVDAMASSKALTKQEIGDLYEILRRAEEEAP